ncbi:MAG: hypothetical protein M3347_12740 [Armatimonadota bacterium]|nr:hypothetical protein [Armatimonadota bacterium]
MRPDEMQEKAGTPKITVVSNTGPLISALQCGRMDLLQQYFSVVYITASEVRELHQHGWQNEIQQFIEEGFIIVVEELSEAEQKAAEQIARDIAARLTSGDPDWQNHLPEAEAMALMQQRTSLAIDQILLDEKAAREVAQELGLRVTGFPGVLGRAGLDGLLTQDEIRQLLKTCQRQGTHYSDTLIETVAQTYGR